MVLGIDPKVDYAFKRVFGDERNAEILIHLLNAILKPANPIVRIEILNPFQEKDFTEEKLTILDIKARDQVGRLLNIEMQLLLPRHFRARILFYWAGLYRQQLQQSHAYDQLRPVISIGIVNQVLFPAVDHYHLTFGLYNRENGLWFSDHMELHLLELPKFRRELDQLHDPLDKWLYFFRHAERMDPQQLPEPFQEPVFRRAIEELKMLTQDDLDRERYESRQKALRDHMSLLDEAREEGCHVGEYIGRIHLCERRLGRVLTATDQLSVLPIETLEQRAEELERELFGH